MPRTLTGFLSRTFPDLGRPRYQSAAEIVSFLLVTTMLIGSLIGGLALLVYEL